MKRIHRQPPSPHPDRLHRPGPAFTLLLLLSFTSPAWAEYAIVQEKAARFEEEDPGGTKIRDLEPHEWGKILVPTTEKGMIRMETNALEIGWMAVDQVELIPDFDRRAWRKHWPDLDGDCINTRHEVLIAESEVPVVHRDREKCWVGTGAWTCPLTGEKATAQKGMHIAHIVPLENAYLSGGFAWRSAQRQRYTNDLEDPDHIFAVAARTNRSRRGKGPERWRPPLESSWCWYARTFERTKKRYGLHSTPGEQKALAEMKATCPAEDEAAAPKDETPEKGEAAAQAQ